MKKKQRSMHLFFKFGCRIQDTDFLAQVSYLARPGVTKCYLNFISCRCIIFSMQLKDGPFLSYRKVKIVALV
jgi:hypothetical protein